MSTAMFKHFGKLLAICTAAATFTSATPAAFAAVDWSIGTVTAVGMGMAPPNAVDATNVVFVLD